jgi:hypothetical protein
MVLSGNINGLKKGTVYLQRIDDTSLIDIDSVIIDGDANFIFEKAIQEPEIHFLYLKLKDGSLKDIRLPFFAEASNIYVNTDLENFVLGAKITGSTNQDKISEHQLLMDRFSEKNLEIIEQLFKAQQQKDDSLISVFDKKQRSLIASRYLATVNFSLRNKDLEVAPYLMSNAIPDVHKKYLDTVYHSLGPEIKNSKYGLELKGLIQDKYSDD